MNIQDAIAECLAPIWADHRHNTARSYHLGMRYFLDYLSAHNIPADTDLSLLTIDHFVGFVTYLQGRYRNKTARVYIAGTKHLMDWLVAMGDLDVDYRAALRIGNVMQTTWRARDNKLPRVPTDDECNKILAAVKQLPEPEPRLSRDIALIQFLYWTGCRNQEACSLVCSDIDLQAHKAWIEAGKGRKSRTVIFTQNVADSLVRYWQGRGWQGRRDPVFARHDKGAGKHYHKPMSTQTVRNIVNEVEAMAGLDGVITPHKFRHHFATALLSRTGNLALVQDILGHSDPRTTRIYAQVTDDQKQSGYHDAFGE